MEGYTLARRERRADSRGTCWRGTRWRAGSGTLAEGVHGRGTRRCAGSGALAGEVHATEQARRAGWRATRWRAGSHALAVRLHAGGEHAGAWGAARWLKGYTGQVHAGAQRAARWMEGYTLARREPRAGWRGTRWFAVERRIGGSGVEGGMGGGAGKARRREFASAGGGARFSCGRAAGHGALEEVKLLARRGPRRVGGRVCGCAAGRGALEEVKMLVRCGGWASALRRRRASGGLRSAEAARWCR